MPPEASGSAGEPTAGSRVDELFPDLDRARPDDHDEQSGQDAEDQREYDLHGCLLRLRLGRLSALDPQLLRLGPQDARDRYTEDIGLDHRERERVQLLDVGPLGEIAERV